MYQPRGVPDLLMRTYYRLRPLIPRRAQIALRRRVARGRMTEVQSLWPIDPRTGGAPPGWRGWPGGCGFALVLTHDVETARGMERCLALAELEEEMGYRSSFQFVPRRYQVCPRLRGQLASRGFEVALHGLYHDGRLFASERVFARRMKEINRILVEWDARGFRSPAMHFHRERIGSLAIDYDMSSFDTDPFEPCCARAGTIFPYLVSRNGNPSFVELPYTLPQDFTLFILLGERDSGIWKRKLDWLAERGGMALVNVHPDYLSFRGKPGVDEYPVAFYRDFLDYVRLRYGDSCWKALPREIAAFWRSGVPPEERGSAG